MSTMRAHAEAQQNALLDPGVHAPAGGGCRVRLGGAHASLVQRGLEFARRAGMLVRVGGGLVLVEPLDFSLQRARSPIRPAASSTFSMRARLAALGGTRGKR